LELATDCSSWPAKKSIANNLRRPERRKHSAFAKRLVLFNCAVPAVLLGWDAWHHQLGANPVNFAILTTGMLALIFLFLTLAVAPLRKVTGLNWIIFSRRTFGLYAFFYALLHFLIFSVWTAGSVSPARFPKWSNAITCSSDDPATREAGSALP
jgi:DMSO/TMAO reductase YedYZ heme-binding membrane subunit